MLKADYPQVILQMLNKVSLKNTGLQWPPSHIPDPHKAKSGTQSHHTGRIRQAR